MTARRRTTGAAHRRTVTLPGDGGELTLVAASGSVVRLADVDVASRLIAAGYTLRRAQHDDTDEPAATG